MQEFIKVSQGSKLTPALGNHVHGASRLEQQRIEHAPNAAFLTVAATPRLSASSQAPGHLHFTVPSVASPDLITLMGYPGLITSFLVAKVVVSRLEFVQQDASLSMRIVCA